MVHGSDSECVVVAQLAHGGRQGLTNPEFVGPSPVPSSIFSKSIRPLSEDEVRSIIECFAAAIVRVKKAGFDGVQLHGAHGFLLSSFLSPHTNLRTVYFGGSIKNRVNIIRGIVSLARETVGEFPVLIKMNCDHFVPGGINMDTFPEVAKEVQNAGLDAIEVGGGM